MANNCFFDEWENYVAEACGQHEDVTLSYIEEKWTKTLINIITDLEKKNQRKLSLSVLEDDILCLKEASKDNKSRFPAIIRCLRAHMKNVDRRSESIISKKNYDKLLSHVKEIQKKIEEYFETTTVPTTATATTTTEQLYCEEIDESSLLQENSVTQMNNNLYQEMDIRLCDLSIHLQNMVIKIYGYQNIQELLENKPEFHIKPIGKMFNLLLI